MAKINGILIDQALTATGASKTLSVNGNSRHGVQVVDADETATVVTGNLQGTVDGTNWFDILAADLTFDPSSVKTAYSSVVDKPVDQVRYNITAETGAMNISVFYIGSK